MIEKIFEWAWKTGLEINLYSHNYMLPAFEEIRVRPRQDVNFTSITRRVAEMPVLRFSAQGRHYEIMGQNWAELLKRLEYEHKKIASELIVPPLLTK